MELWFTCQSFTARIYSSYSSHRNSSFSRAMLYDYLWHRRVHTNIQVIPALSGSYLRPSQLSRWTSNVYLSIVEWWSNYHLLYLPPGVSRTDTNLRNFMTILFYVINHYIIITFFCIITVCNMHLFLINDKSWSLTH